MKKILVWLTVLLMLAAPASAEILGRSAEGDYICRYTADNGQDIYYVSLNEMEYVEKKDLNGDGQEDLSILVSLGASNAWYDFYLYQEGRYVQAQRDGYGYGLVNYSLTDQGYIETRSNDGCAGALFTACIFRWEGIKLQCLRSMVSSPEETFVYDGSASITTQRDDRIHIRFFDLTQDENGWETTVEIEDMTPAFFDALNDRLWAGLR